MNSASIFLEQRIWFHHSVSGFLEQRFTMNDISDISITTYELCVTINGISDISITAYELCVIINGISDITMTTYELRVTLIVISDIAMTAYRYISVAALIHCRGLRVMTATLQEQILTLTAA